MFAGSSEGVWRGGGVTLLRNIKIKQGLVENFYPGFSLINRVKENIYFRESYLTKGF